MQKINTITALPALQDNYIWVIQGNDASKIVIVDPGDARPVLEYIKTHNLILDGILLTHHHGDHSGGIRLLLEHYPDVRVYSSTIDKVPGVTHCVQEGESIVFAHLSHPIHVLEIPGHTLGHIAFVYGDAVFSGDTLFSVGAGKIFEGTASQMYHSLHKLKCLPKETLVYCGHEYTLANIAFAQQVDPHNPLLEQRKKEVQALRAHHLPSVPVMLETELQTNPFLRCDVPHVISAVQEYIQQPIRDPIAILLALREWKNHSTF